MEILTFKVSITIGRIEPQDEKAFKSEDGAAMVPYLKEKLEDAVKEAWQYNAKVIKSKVTKL